MTYYDYHTIGVHHLSQAYNYLIDEIEKTTNIFAKENEDFRRQIQCTEQADITEITRKIETLTNIFTHNSVLLVTLKG